MTALFMGLSMGGNVLIAQYFGAKNREGLRSTMHTAIVLFMSAGLVLSAVAIAASPMLLRLTGTPDDVYPMALIYMRLLFSGIVFQITYNMLAGFLRGMGDSRTQMYILAITSVVNAGLCWLFVIIFQWGVTGAGVATVISQFVSVVVMFYRLQRNELTRISLSELKLRLSYAKSLLSIGFPTAIQQVSMSLAATVVMGYVTSYGTENIAGYSVGTTIEMYVGMPVSALNMTASPYAAQNVGAGKMERVYQGAKQMAMINAGLNLVMVVLVLTFSAPLLRLFTDNPGTIAAGILMLRIMVPTHIMTAINQPLSGVIRGSGSPVTPMINSVMMTIGIRIPLIILFTPIFNRIEVVYFSQAIANLIGLIHILIVYKKGKWRARALAKIDELYSASRVKDTASST